MSASDAAHLQSPDVARRTAAVVRNVFGALAGLVVGAIAGLVIAGYAGWFSLNVC